MNTIDGIFTPFDKYVQDQLNLRRQIITNPDGQLLSTEDQITIYGRYYDDYELEQLGKEFLLEKASDTSERYAYVSNGWVMEEGDGLMDKKGKMLTGDDFIPGQRSFESWKEDDNFARWVKNKYTTLSTVELTEYNGGPTELNMSRNKQFWNFTTTKQATRKIVLWRCIKSRSIS